MSLDRDPIQTLSPLPTPPHDNDLVRAVRDEPRVDFGWQKFRIVFLHVTNGSGSGGKETDEGSLAGCRLDDTTARAANPMEKVLR